MTDVSIDDSHLGLDSSLEPQFASLLSRHREAAAKTQWSYQQFLPPEIDRQPLSPGAYMAVETALLTEVNLPWYTAALAHGLASCPGPIRAFVRLWTSEEDQHATLLESYLMLTRSGDPDRRACSRRAMIAEGWSAGLAGPFQGMVYTALQEAATRTFYLCVARAFGDEYPPLGAALRRIAKDETLHMTFYRDVVKLHLDKDPDYLRPLAAVMVRFEMPWSASVLDDFEERRAYLATRGVFRLSDYLDEVVQPLWSYWGLDHCVSQNEETRKGHAQLRRYRAALRKFARSEARPPANTCALPAEP